VTFYAFLLFLLAPATHSRYSPLRNQSVSIAGGATCVLQGGEVVENGWKGPNTDVQYCNTCSCDGGSLKCTTKDCRPPRRCTLADGTLSKKDFFGADTSNYCACFGAGLLTCTRQDCVDDPPAHCQLTDGSLVAHGYEGSDTGANYCNICRCSNGKLTCTDIQCQDKSDGKCALRDGALLDDNTYGFDTWDNYCNMCVCHSGKLMCTEILCPPRGRTCTLADGTTIVQDGYRGYDRGDNYCNICTCANGDLRCSRNSCPPRRRCSCQLTDRTLVPEGFLGHDTGLELLQYLLMSVRKTELQSAGVQAVGDIVYVSGRH